MPTPSPTPAPTPTPETNTCSPAFGQIVFDDVDHAISFDTGKIEVYWYPARFVRPEDVQTFECGEPTYHVFLCPQGFNFAGLTIGQLRTYNECTEHQTTGLFLKLSELTPGVTYDGNIIATANHEAVVSNSDKTFFSITVASSNHIVNPNVKKIHGPFFADATFQINVVDATDGDINDLTVTFSGVLPAGINELKPDEHITGIDSDEKHFWILLVEEIEDMADSKSWKGKRKQLLDVLSGVDLNTSHGASSMLANAVNEPGGNNGNYVPPSSGGGSQDRRQLSFFSHVFHDVSKDVKSAVHTVEQVVHHDFGKTFTIEIGKFGHSFTKELFDGLIELNAGVEFGAHLDIGVTVGFPPAKFESGKAIFVGDATAAASVTIEKTERREISKEEPIWEGETVKKVVFVDVVPIIITFKPSVDAVLDGEVEVGLKGEVKAGVSKELQIGAAYESGRWSPVHSLTNLKRGLDGVDGLASAELFASADVGFQFKVEVNVDIIMGVTPSIEAGAELEFKAGAATNEDPPYFVETFDIGFFLAFPLDVHAFGFSHTFNFPKLTFPLIGLPTVTLVPQYTNTCQRSGLQENVPVSSIDTAVFVRFEVRSDDRSVISNPSEGPYRFETDDVTTADSRIKVENCGGTTCDLLIPRSAVVKGDNDIALRDSVITVRSSVKFPPVDYILKSDSSLKDIIQKFDCCDSRDCAVGEVCDDGFCR
mmetsp:Transcript_10011/g.23148  ORF Transcript_10011/g.23148 Transcript_10011/m.23148 type:complete len:709 (+) Transcript_10011:129-2255(+)